MALSVALLARGAAAAAAVAQADASIAGSDLVPQAFLGTLPPSDAIAVKSWAFLKQSMENLGRESAVLVRAKNDL